MKVKIVKTDIVANSAWIAGTEAEVSDELAAVLIAAGVAEIEPEEPRETAARQRARK